MDDNILKRTEDIILLDDYGPAKNKHYHIFHNGERGHIFRIEGGFLWKLRMAVSQVVPFLRYIGVEKEIWKYIESKTEEESKVIKEINSGEYNIEDHYLAHIGEAHKLSKDKGRSILVIRLNDEPIFTENILQDFI